MQKLGFAALHCAVDGGHFDVVRALLAAGADVNVKRTGTFDTPAHVACTSAGLDAPTAVRMLELLLENGADLTATNHVSV